MVRVLKFETIADKLANVEAKTLVDTLPKTIAGIQVLNKDTDATHCLRWRTRP